MENGQAEFDKLFSRYLSGISTRKERNRLYELISSGHFDDRIGEDMLSSLKSESSLPGSFSEMARIDRLYDEKIKGEITHASVGTTETTRRRILPGPGWWVAVASVSGIILVLGLWFFNSGTQTVTDNLSASYQSEVPEQPEPLVRFVDKQWIRLPDGSTVSGTATAIDRDGRLVLATSRGEIAVAAGDVTHLRYE